MSLSASFLLALSQPEPNPTGPSYILHGTICCKSPIYFCHAYCNQRNSRKGWFVIKGLVILVLGHCLCLQHLEEKEHREQGVARRKKMKERMWGKDCSYPPLLSTFSQFRSSFLPKLLHKQKALNLRLVRWIAQFFYHSSLPHTHSLPLLNLNLSKGSPGLWAGTDPRPIGNRIAQVAGEHMKLHLRMHRVRLRMQNHPLPLPTTTAGP